MREILFRGKRTDNGEWVYGDLVRCSDVSETPHTYFWVDTGKKFPLNIVEYEVDPETVGQYTGVTDKNGRKIFEGDILNGLMGTMVVFFGEIIGEGYGFQWKTVSGNPRNAESMTGFVDEYEVIGNIHDNPEFLEVKS